MGDIIDFKVRSKAKSTETLESPKGSEIVDITERRSELLRQDRRRVKRTILTEFIAVHAVVPAMGLMKVFLFDINEEGLSFDIETARGHFRSGEEIALRVYLNHQTYFPFIAKIRHVTEISEEGVVRHGAEFVKGSLNDVALHHFIKFIETVSASLKSDKGDIVVSNINS